MILALTPAASQAVLAAGVFGPITVVWAVHRAAVRRLDWRDPGGPDAYELLALAVDPDDDFEIPVHDVA